MNDKDWIKITELSIKYDTYTMSEFIEMVKQQVPEGTKDTDIRLDFEASDGSNPYYDDLIIESILTISIRK